MRNYILSDGQLPVNRPHSQKHMGFDQKRLENIKKQVETIPNYVELFWNRFQFAGEKRREPAAQLRKTVRRWKILAKARDS